MRASSKKRKVPKGTVTDGKGSNGYPLTTEGRRRPELPPKKNEGHTRVNLQLHNSFFGGEERGPMAK